MALKFEIIPVTPFQQNCSLLWCTKTNEAALVDPGGEVEKLLGAVERNGVTLTKIWLTHGHMDHVGGTAELMKQTGVSVEGPQQADAFWIDALDQQAQMMGFAKVDGFVPHRWLCDGDQLMLGELQFDVIHTPGHTPGHVVIFNAAEKLAFVGDVLFNGSIGRTDFPMSNHNDLLRSIRKKLWPLGDVTFVPGHGPQSTFSNERKNNPFVADHR